jgi:hypothetical protein
MLISTTHYNHINQIILDYLKSIGHTPSSWTEQYLNASLSQKRARWDATYESKLTKYICDELYSYMNDTHIDTALRKIFNHQK